MTKEFKKKAYDTTISALISLCKRKKILNCFMESLITHLGSSIHNPFKMNEFELILLNLINKKFWEKVRTNTVSQIEQNFDHFSREKNEYDYLVHCVNTIIQLYLESYLKKRSIDPQSFGESVFRLSGKKLFGLDFEVKQVQQPIVEEFNINDITNLWSKAALNDMDIDRIFKILNSRTDNYYNIETYE